MPGRGEAGEYGEVTSTSDCTDYQSRRLNIRYKPTGQKGTRFVHTLNGTAVALSRALIVVLENYQRADGLVDVPEVLRPYLGKDVIGEGTVGLIGRFRDGQRPVQGHGVLLILIGLGLALTVLAFASLVDPSLQGDAWWAAFWVGMERADGAAWGWAWSRRLIGAWLLVVPPGPGRRSRAGASRAGR